MLQAVSRGAQAGATGVLVDEQFGGDIPSQAKEKGLKLAMPVEKSGQDEFDFEYGEDFGAHIERFDPNFSKVLVRYNPDGDAEMNREQLGRLKRLADWLHEQPEAERAASPRASSCSSCWCRPPRSSWPRWEGTPSATTPSSGPT
jgi:myo-inositol catabolism protein IolC